MTQAMLAIVAKLLQTLGSFLAETKGTLRNGVFTTYHPEQHYMRGPGPKWREKHPGGRVT